MQTHVKVLGVLYLAVSGFFLVGALFLILALVGRSPQARKHVMHVAVALALLAVIG